MISELKSAIAEAAKHLFNVDIDPEVDRPEEKFGDYSTNVSMRLAKQLGKSPNEIAGALRAEIEKLDFVSTTSEAGPFINIKLTDEALARAVSTSVDLPKPLDGQEMVVEYSDPNPFKVLHVGHLYTSVVGDSIATMLEASGAKIHRVNFGGDVGLHVAKAMWDILGKLEGENPEKLSSIPIEERAKWLTESYIAGSLAYGDDERIDNEIRELNRKIYSIITQQDHDSPLAQIYWATRQWSYDYFNDFYSRIGTNFEKYYPESETVELGMKAVQENIGDVFKESNGAVVFSGEVHNLHTRVFINSEGLPTYETKDVGLLLKKWDDYHFDKSIIITGNDINEYMQVVLKAVEQFAPELAKKTIHITHGMVKLADGAKMSSRKGNIISAESVLNAVFEANKRVNNHENPDVALGAVKYAFLKNRIGSDIVFDPDESVSIEGHSGPYLQYAHARASSILAKAEGTRTEIKDFEDGERSLARKISEYPEVVAKAANELMPHHVANYLYELAQVFNRFYENNRVIDDPRQSVRLELVSSYAKVLKDGLGLLNIVAPEKM